MKNRFLVYTAFLMLSVSCNNTSQKEHNQRRKPGSELYIVATTGMIGDVVSNIVKDKAKVEWIMGPGVDPHLYKATKSDLDKIRNASMIFYNGLTLEAKMADILDKISKEKPIYAVGVVLKQEEIRKLEGTHNELDPHIWLDVRIWIAAAQLMGEKIAEYDPENKEFYLKNTKDYIAQLEKLHQKIGEGIGKIPEESRVLVTAHDALGYFGRAYNIEVRGLQGLSTSAEFGLKDVTNLVDFIVKRKIKAVFVETFISQRSLESVINGCKEKGHEVKIGGTLYTDAVGQKGTPESSYIGMLEANLKTIAEALK